MNKVMLIGHLGRDPEMRYMPNGDPVANFSVATSERWTDKQSGEKKERTEWARCNIFGKRAEAFCQYVKKGHRVYVEGKMQTRKYTDKSGVERYTTEIVVRDFEFLQPKGSSLPPHPADDPSYGRDARTRPAAPAASSEPHDDGAPPPTEPPTGDFDDDIPF